MSGATKACTGAANDLSVAMAELDEARVMLMLAVKAVELNADDAKHAFWQLQQITDDVHNQIDCVREALEA